MNRGTLVVTSPPGPLSPVASLSCPVRGLLVAAQAVMASAALATRCGAHLRLWQQCLLVPSVLATCSDELLQAGVPREQPMFPQPIQGSVRSCSSDITNRVVFVDGVLFVVLFAGATSEALHGTTSHVLSSFYNPARWAHHTIITVKMYFLPQSQLLMQTSVAA